MADLAQAVNGAKYRAQASSLFASEEDSRAGRSYEKVPARLVSKISTFPRLCKFSAFIGRPGDVPRVERAGVAVGQSGAVGATAARISADALQAAFL